MKFMFVRKHEPREELLAIVGSTLLAGSNEARRLIHEAIELWKPVAIVSGGAPGIDTIAIEIAEARGLGTVVFPPRILRWEGRGGFKQRNLYIARCCTVLVRIKSSRTKTYGSGWTRDEAKRLGKPTQEFVVYH